LQPPKDIFSPKASLREEAKEYMISNLWMKKEIRELLVFSTLDSSQVRYMRTNDISL
jgi:hypothetical protein